MNETCTMSRCRKKATGGYIIVGGKFIYHYCIRHMHWLTRELDLGEERNERILGKNPFQAEEIYKKEKCSIH